MQICFLTSLKFTPKNFIILFELFLPMKELVVNNARLLGVGFINDHSNGHLHGTWCGGQYFGELLKARQVAQGQNLEVIIGGFELLALLHDLHSSHLLHDYLLPDMPNIRGLCLHNLSLYQLREFLHRAQLHLKHQHDNTSGSVNG